MTDLLTISAFMEGHASSGLSVAGYARQIGMSQWQAYEWRKRWRRHQRQREPEATDGVTPVGEGTADASIVGTSQAAAESMGGAFDPAPAGSSLFRQVVPAGESPAQTGPTDASLSLGSLRIAVGSGCQLTVTDRQGVALAALFVRQLQAEVG